jgi:hypothetical protein
MVVPALLVIASSPGCGMDKSKEGPPFEPDNLDGPRSLLITNSDIEAVGASTPYAVVLHWWQALQRGEVHAVKRSYAGRISSREAKREIDRFKHRFSQPVEPDVQTQGNRANRATVRTIVRAATRSAETPSVVSINDFAATFVLVRKAGEWKLRDDSYSRYVERRRTSHPPPPSG